MINVKIGTLDLDPRYEYMIVYRDKRYDTINTWTLNESAFQVNYKQMKNSGHVEFLGVYKKLNDSQLLDVMTRQEYGLHKL